MLNYTVEPHSDHIVRCILTQTSRTRWNQGQLGQSAWDQQGTCRRATSPVTCNWKEGNSKEIYGLVTDVVIKQIEEMALKDGAVKEINSKDRK
jgi:hypothetical protein